MRPASNTSAQQAARRRGVVIVAVLVVVTVLALSAYRYNDAMLSENKVSESVHRNVQARHFADSGIHFAAALLSNPQTMSDALGGGNPWNNSSAFKGVAVQGDNVKGKFSLIAPPDPDDSAAGNFYYGVSDESGKINPNALMKIDTTGQLAHDMLLKLPNMTEEIANAIVDWMDPDSDTRPGGAENDYYSALTPPYRCKNGPIDSIDELLLVKGVTRDLLYGSDWNRNGFQESDGSENGSSGFLRGWAAFLTVHSREQNRDTGGTPYVFLNNADLQNKVYALLSPDVGDDLAKYIVMYRQYGPASSTGGTQSLGSTIASLFGGAASTAKPSTAVNGKVSDYTLNFTRSPKTTINSVFELVNTQVSIQSVDAKNKTITTLYPSPLNDAGSQRDLLTKLLNVVTLTDDTEPEIPARININSAPREVLASLTAAASELTDNDVEKIISTRPKTSLQEGLPEIYQTPAWLLTEAQISLATLQKLDKYITARTQVYRVQSVGYFDGKGPAIRVEAVIDTNSGRPRILAWRDLSELGKGFSETP